MGIPYQIMSHGKGGVIPLPVVFLGVLFSIMNPSAAVLAQAEAQTPSTIAPDSPTAVLDIENRRIVTSARLPRDASPTCDVLVMGGGTGGVAAAIAAGLRGMSVIRVEPTSALGGQFT